MPADELEHLREELAELKENPLGKDERGKTLLDAVNTLNTNINKLITLFANAEKEIVNEFENTKTVGEQLDELKDQNTKIAQGILTVADMMQNNQQLSSQDSQNNQESSSQPTTRGGNEEDVAPPQLRHPTQNEQQSSTQQPSTQQPSTQNDQSFTQNTQQQTPQEAMNQGLFSTLNTQPPIRPQGNQQLGPQTAENLFTTHTPRAPEQDPWAPPQQRAQYNQNQQSSMMRGNQPPMPPMPPGNEQQNNNQQTQSGLPPLPDFPANPHMPLTTSQQHNQQQTYSGNQTQTPDEQSSLPPIGAQNSRLGQPPMPPPQKKKGLFGR